MHTRSTHLSLNEISRDDLTPVAIEEGKSGAKGRRRYSPQNSLSNDTSPARLCLVDSCEIEWVLH